MANRSYEYNKENVKFAKDLRTNMTKQEKMLWYDFLSLLPVTAHRQKNIGNYIVDFYCHEKRLVIELDGSQHYEEEGKKADVERDAFLREQGMLILRYSNADVNQRFEGVCEDILRHLEER